MLKKSLFMLLFAGMFLPLFAQRVNLAADMPFFEKKAQEYQRWLTIKGYAPAVQVELVRLKVDKYGHVDSTEIELFLLLQATDIDTAFGKWNRLKKDVDTDADSLEAVLFRTFVHFMEIPEEQGNIQIYVRDKKGLYIANNHIWIWAENGLIASQKKGGTTRAKSFDINVAYPVKTTGKGKQAKVTAPKRRSANAVFNLIVQYTGNALINQPRYQTELTDRRPHFENDSVRTATTFRFTVADMGKEVLTNQTRTIWEPWVGLNTIAMERLTFEFEYIPVDKSSYVLKCTIVGKYGSGIFKPRVSGYDNMEPDFDDFFEHYKNEFRLKLQQLLQQP